MLVPVIHMWLGLNELEHAKCSEDSLTHHVPLLLESEAQAGPLSSSANLQSHLPLMPYLYNGNVNSLGHGTKHLEGREMFAVLLIPILWPSIWLCAGLYDVFVEFSLSSFDKWWVGGLSKNVSTANHHLLVFSWTLVITVHPSNDICNSYEKVRGWQAGYLCTVFVQSPGSHLEKWIRFCVPVMSKHANHSSFLGVIWMVASQYFVSDLILNALC